MMLMAEKAIKGEIAIQYLDLQKKNIYIKSFSQNKDSSCLVYLEKNYFILMSNASKITCRQI